MRILIWNHPYYWNKSFWSLLYFSKKIKCVLRVQQAHTIKKYFPKILNFFFLKLYIFWKEHNVPLGCTKRKNIFWEKSFHKGTLEKLQFKLIAKQKNITNLIFMEGILSNFPEFFQNFFNFSLTMHNQKYVKYNVHNVYNYFLD